MIQYFNRLMTGAVLASLCFLSFSVGYFVRDQKDPIENLTETLAVDREELLNKALEAIKNGQNTLAPDVARDGPYLNGDSKTSDKYRGVVSKEIGS